MGDFVKALQEEFIEADSIKEISHFNELEKAVKRISERENEITVL